MQNPKTTGVYIHIPFCRSKCYYCGFVSCVNLNIMRQYVNSLKQEIKERISGNVDTVYVGGGTPSVLYNGMLTEIIDAVKDNANITKDCEITVEANPDSCNDEFLCEAVNCGVNRLSMGIQSLNDNVLSRIGRRHNAEQARTAVFRAKEYGLKNISCDLMLGLPEQTLQDVIFAIDTLSEWGVKHISAYALSVEENTPLYAGGYKVSDDDAADMYEYAYSKLCENGFFRYEVSNFCRDGYYSRHNKKYWLLEPYTGVGVAAHSFDGRMRLNNTSDINRYIAGCRDEQKHEVTNGEKTEEYIMLGLRTSDGLNLNTLSEICGYDWKKTKSDEINRLESDGFLQVRGNILTLTDKAYFVMNEIIVRLM